MAGLALDALAAGRMAAAELLCAAGARAQAPGKGGAGGEVASALLRRDAAAAQLLLAACEVAWAAPDRAVGADACAVPTV